MLPSAVSDSRVHNILPNKIETDFQFSRASAATRVNHQGLIENVGYFSDELVQNGDFSELGSELVTNGDFSNGSSNWNIQAGTVVFINNTVELQGASIINQSGVTSPSTKTYKVTYTVKSTSGNPVLKLYNGSWFTVNSTVGTHTEYFVPNSVTFYLRNDSSDNITIDNVSVKQVDPNDRWTLDTGWSYGSNKVTGSATTSEIEQDVDLPSGKVYKTTFTIEDYVSGDVRIRFRGGSTVNGSNRSGNGTYTQILTSTGHTNIKIDGGTSFTGSVTNVSVVEVIGDKPRLDYDPLNPTCPHLLLEPQSTNLATFSEDFNQNAWGKGDAQILSSTNKNPDGTTNAKVLAYNGGTNQHYMQITPSVSSGQNYTFSIFLKAKELKYVCLIFLNNFGGRYFDLENGTILGTAGPGVGDSKIEDFGNGWYRCSITDSATSTTKFSGVYLSEDGSSIGPIVPTNTDGVYVWGAQFEQLNYPTSYIPTAGSTETRVQETCTSAGNLNTFNNSEGTIYAEIAGLVSSTTLRSIGISDGTSANRVNISLWKNGGNDQLLNFVGLSGVSQCNFFGAVNSILEFNKVAFNYKQNDFKMYINGVLAGTDTSGNTFPADTLIKFNFDRGEGSTRFFGKTKSLATYNRALTDTELYTITSTQYSAYSGMVAALGNYTIPC